MERVRYIGHFIFSIFLSLAVVLAPLHGYAASLGTIDERAVAEEAFFLDLRDRIEIFMRANKAKIHQLRLCLKAEIDPTRFRAANKGYCKTQLGIVRDNIRVLYPRMRHYLITRELLKPTNHRATYELKKPHPDLRASAQHFSSSQNRTQFLSFLSSPKPAKKLPDTFENPLEAQFDGVKMPFAKASNLELKRAIEGFPSADGTVSRIGYGVQQFYRDTCLTSPALYPYLKATKEKIPRQICDQISLRFDQETQSTSWHFSSNMPVRYLLKNTRLGQSIIQFPGSISYDTKIDKQLESLYYETIQANPYVALVTSAKPDPASLLRAFEQMHKAASNTLYRFIRFQKKLDQERSLFTNTIDWFKSSDQRTSTLELLNYTPAVGHLMEVPGERMDLLYEYPFADLAQALNGENSTAQMKKVGKQIAGLIAANIAVCWLPWSKAASTLGRVTKISLTGGRLSKALSPMCFALTTIPLNTYMLNDAFHEYAIAYEEIFSGLDEDQYETSNASKTHYIREIRSLSAAQSNIFWSLLFMPIGTKEVRLALQKNIPSLSAHTLKRVQRYLDRRGY